MSGAPSAASPVRRVGICPVGRARGRRRRDDGDDAQRHHRLARPPALGGHLPGRRRVEPRDRPAPPRRPRGLGEPGGRRPAGHAGDARDPRRRGRGALHRRSDTADGPHAQVPTQRHHHARGLLPRRVRRLRAHAGRPPGRAHRAGADPAPQRHHPAAVGDRARHQRRRRAARRRGGRADQPRRELPLPPRLAGAARGAPGRDPRARRHRVRRAGGALDPRPHRRRGRRRRR